jgi:hypothetical protein
MATRRFPEPTYMFTLVDRGADLLLAAGRIGLGIEADLRALIRRMSVDNPSSGTEHTPIS